MNTEQPRTPAGSPDGGQFAPTVGQESDTFLDAATPAPTPSPEQVKLVEQAASNAEAHLGHLGSVAYRSDLEFYEQSLNEMARAARLVCPDAQTLHLTRPDHPESPGAVRLDRISCPHVSADDGTDEVDGYDGGFCSRHGIENDPFESIRWNLNDSEIQLHKMLNMTHNESFDGYTVNLDEFTIAPPQAPFGKVAARELETHQRAYAALGLKVAALLGSSTDWNGGDDLEAIAEMAQRHGFRIGDQSDEDLARWRGVAEEFGWAVEDDVL